MEAQGTAAPGAGTGPAEEMETEPSDNKPIPNETRSEGSGPPEDSKSDIQSHSQAFEEVRVGGDYSPPPEEAMPFETQQPSLGDFWPTLEQPGPSGTPSGLKAFNSAILEPGTPTGESPCLEAYTPPPEEAMPFEFNEPAQGDRSQPPFQVPDLAPGGPEALVPRALPAEPKNLRFENAGFREDYSPPPEESVPFQLDGEEFGGDSPPPGHLRVIPQICIGGEFPTVAVPIALCLPPAENAPPLWVQGAIDRPFREAIRSPPNFACDTSPMEITRPLLEIGRASIGVDDDTAVIMDSPPIASDGPPIEASGAPDKSQRAERPPVEREAANTERSLTTTTEMERKLSSLERKGSESFTQPQAMEAKPTPTDARAVSAEESDASGECSVSATLPRRRKKDPEDVGATQATPKDLQRELEEERAVPAVRAEPEGGAVQIATATPAESEVSREIAPPTSAESEGSRDPVAEPDSKRSRDPAAEPDSEDVPATKKTESASGTTAAVTTVEPSKKAESPSGAAPVIQMEPAAAGVSATLAEPAARAAPITPMEPTIRAIPPARAGIFPGARPISASARAAAAARAAYAGPLVWGARSLSATPSVLASLPSRAAVAARTASAVRAVTGGRSASAGPSRVYLRPPSPEIQVADPPTPRPVPRPAVWPEYERGRSCCRYEASSGICEIESSSDESEEGATGCFQWLLRRNRRPGQPRSHTVGSNPVRKFFARAFGSCFGLSECTRSRSLSPGKAKDPMEERRKQMRKEAIEMREQKRADKKRSKIIDKQLEEEKMDYMCTHRLLLLGNAAASAPGQ